jgi:para-aminobenzoate synthetase component 1
MKAPSKISQSTCACIPFNGLEMLLRNCGPQVMLRWERDCGVFRGFLDFDSFHLLDRCKISHDLKVLGLQQLATQSIASSKAFSGWVGFFGYEWLCALRGIECRAPQDIEGIPDGILARPGITFTIHDDTVRIYGDNPDKVRFWQKRLCKPYSPPVPNPIPGGEMSDTSLNCDFATYEQIFAKAKEALRDGETYQIKLSIRHQAPAPDPAEAFAKLMQSNPAPEAFFLCWNEFALISCSPETVIDLRNNTLATRPIGGTFPRDTAKPSVAAETLRDAFAADSKESAEHNMLIDLERNDLNTVCQSGSVHITHLREVESYAHVHHLVTRIAGELNPNVSRADILKALLPGGSITGCPKHRTIELIDLWEPSFRGPYTGSFGTLEDNGNIHLNLIIRTLMIKGESAFVQAGGGIVIESNPAYEYRENLLKGQALLELLQYSK